MNDDKPGDPHLSTYYGFNDKTSAIRLFNFINPNNLYNFLYVLPEQFPGYNGNDFRVVFSGYENDTYKGKVIYCIATYSPNANILDPTTATHQDWKLGIIGFNDKITSIELQIATVQQINISYPAHDPIIK